MLTLQDNFMVHKLFNNFSLIWHGLNVSILIYLDYRVEIVNVGSSINRCGGVDSISVVILQFPFATAGATCVPLLLFNTRHFGYWDIGVFIIIKLTAGMVNSASCSRNLAKVSPVCSV